MRTPNARVRGRLVYCGGMAWLRQTLVRARARAAAVCCSGLLPRRARRLPVVPLAVALAAGIACAVSLLPACPEAVMACWAMAVGALGIWWWLAKRSLVGAAVVVLWLTVAVAGAAWGLARHGLFAADDVAWRLGDQPVPLAIEGVVTEAPRPLPGMLRDPETGEPVRPATESTIRVVRLREGPRWVQAAGTASVMIDGPAPQVSAGSRIRLFGRGLRPAAATNPGEYDFRAEARSRRCLSVIRCQSADCLEVLAGPPWWHPGPSLERLRRRGSQLLQASMPRSVAGLADALLLGNREWLPREQTQPFLVTGTIHILAISGLHVGILAWALFRLVRTTPLGRGAALVSVAAMTGGYMILVHAQVPVVRATLIVWLACLAAWLGRRPVGINSLAVVAILVMLRQPMGLFRTGTQLSFLSTAVLILLATAVARERQPLDPIARLIEQSRHPLERRLRAVGRGVLGSVLAGAAVWAVTAPLVAMQYHVVSPIALVLNPLIAPLVAVAMGCGLVALLVGLVSPWLAAGPAAGCAAVLRLIQTAAESAAGVPGAYAWVSGPSLAWVTGWYLAVLVSVVLAGRVDLRQVWRWSVPCLIWLTVGLAAWTTGWSTTPPGQSLEVTLASMRHGLGIVVRPPSGEVLVYDAGRLGAPAAARRAMEAVLRDAGIERIDLLVLSHADADHFNAVSELLERFTVCRLAVAPPFLQSDSPEAQAVLREANQRQIPLDVLTAGTPVAFSETATLQVLHPLAGDVADGNDNAASLVLTVEAAGRRLLLTGDLDGDAVDELLARGVPECDAMVAPHHGSRTSLPPRLAEAVRPRVVLISGTGDSGWEAVREAYAATGPDGMGADVACTCRQSAIRLRMEPHGLHLSRGTAEGWGEAVSLPPSTAASTAIGSVR